MGINRFSIYDSFGDKKGLFLACIEAYGQEVSERQTACLLNPSGAEGIRKFFATLLPPKSRQTNPGCLVMNSLVELSGQDRDIDVAITANLQFVESRMYTAVHAALKAGDFISGRSARAIARQQLSVTQSVLAFSKMRHGTPIAKAAISGFFSSLTTSETTGH